MFFFYRTKLLKLKQRNTFILKAYTGRERERKRDQENKNRLNGFENRKCTFFFF